MYVVFGANGRAGGETSRSLLAKNLEVRVVLRRPEQSADWRARGADVAIANLEDADAVASALRGATGAFLLSPPPVTGDPYRTADIIGRALAQGAKQAGLPKAVVLSSVGAQHAAGTGVISTLHQIETLLANVVPRTAFLRPGYYVEAWSEVIDSVVAGSVLPTFIEPDLKIPMVSTIDVGEAAARLLQETWSGNRIVELGGPDDWSARDVALAFSRVIGRPIDPQFVPEAGRKDIYLQAGLGEEVADALLGMYDGIATGKVAWARNHETWRGATSLDAAVARLVPSGTGNSYEA